MKEDDCKNRGMEYKNGITFRCAYFYLNSYFMQLLDSFTTLCCPDEFVRIIARMKSQFLKCENENDKELMEKKFNLEYIRDKYNP